MQQPVSDDEPCEILEWDSLHFGVKIGRVRADRLEPTSLAAIERWRQRHGVACLYFFCRGDDAASSQLAESGGYRLVDVRLTLDRSSGAVVENAAASAKVRAAEASDVPELERIAATSHRDSRFYFDEHFARPACDALYATWIRESCRGWADRVWVAEHADRPAAYITCHREPGGGAGRIGLLAVAAGARGAGLGGALVGTCLNWLAGNGASRASVVTQGRNAAAQRLYQRCGFVTREMQLVFHKWHADAMMGVGE